MGKYTKVGNIISIILFSVFLLYIADLEKNNCVCSEDWKREHIKYHSILIIGINSLLFFLPNMKTYYKLIHPIMGLLGIAFIITTLLWIGDLKEEKCKCSENWKRSFMEIYTYIIVIVYALLFVAFSFLIYSIHKTLRRLKIQHKLPKKKTRR